MSKNEDHLQLHESIVLVGILKFVREEEDPVKKKKKKKKPGGWCQVDMSRQSENRRMGRRNNGRPRSPVARRFRLLIEAELVFSLIRAFVHDNLSSLSLSCLSLSVLRGMRRTASSRILRCLD